MTVRQTIRRSARWLTLLAASSLTALIVGLAPDVGAGMLAGLIAGWVALGIARVVVLIGLARQIHFRIAAAGEKGAL